MKSLSAKNSLPGLSRLLIAPIPLVFLQPLLGRVVRGAASKRPELFRRLGVHAKKDFLIDPLDMPFVLLLSPDPQAPRLRAVRRHTKPGYNAKISGTFLTLLNMVDGRLDGDALFFSRDLSVEGDTEAVVCLRNCLDDLEGSIADDIAALFGSVGRHVLELLRNKGHHTYGH